MSTLYDLRLLIEERIKLEGLDPMVIKGKIGLRSGKLLALIPPSNPDDPVVIAKLKHAAKETPNLNL